MVPFWIAVIVVAASCALITIRTLIGYSDFKLVYKLLISFLVLAGWFAPLWTGGIRKYNLLSGEAASIAYTGGYILFGFAFLFFATLFLRDVCWFITYWLSKYFHFNFISPHDVAALNKANLWAFVLSLVLGAYSLYEGFKYPNLKEITIESPKVKKDTNILVMTDLHLNRISPQKHTAELVRRVNALKPDAVVLVGDIIDDLYGIDKNLQELSKLKAPYGVFAVLGNHEVYRGFAFSQVKFKEYGFKFLLNAGESLKDRGVYIGGISDYSTREYHQLLAIDLDKTLKDAQKSDYKVLLSHGPKFIDTLKNNEIDLQISGHTHGGQIFPFHIGAKKANGYLAGLYDVGQMKIFVSRGAGTWGPPMRLLAPADITLIHLKAAK